MLYYYNSKGELYAYCQDETTLYTFDGSPIGYFDNDSIFNFEGKHIGFYKEGQVWDHSGKVLLFTKYAKFGDGPLKPKKSLIPLKKLKGKIPLKKRKLMGTQKPLKHRKWSSIPPALAFLSA